MPQARKTTQKAIKPPAFIELETINDVARLACALERAPLPVFCSQRDSKYMLSAQMDLFLGMPVFYFTYSTDTKQFLGYRTSGAGEEVNLVDSASNSSFTYAPVIEVAKFPRIFEKGLQESITYSGAKFLSMQLKDLTSLYKVASYKTLFEEPPLPVFVFPVSKSQDWVLGTFTRIEEYEEASIFFFCRQDSKPEQNFIAHSNSRTHAFLTNRTDEPGHFYVKIVRLKQPHPLVETE